MRFAATEALRNYNRSSRQFQRRTKARGVNLKRKMQHEGITEELNAAREGFKKPWKILRGLIPVTAIEDSSGLIPFIAIEDSTPADSEADKEIQKAF